MSSTIRAVRPILVLCLGLTAMGCKPGGVGDPCIPEDEYQTTFAGYDQTEVNVETRSFQCETRVCLVNHFRGRVSCPYGQAAADLNKAGQDPGRCRVPGTSGAKDTDVIQVEVKPQLVARTAAASPKHGGAMVEDAVYCSCRCANAEGSRDDGASYCDCPSGYECTKLIDDLGLGSSELAGSYCIENGTADSLGVDWGVCSSVAANCGNGGKNP